MVKTFLKILWRRFFVPRSKRLLVSSATLSCKTRNILTLSMLVYYNINSFLSEKFNNQFNNQGFKHNFFILRFHCFIFLLNLFYYFQILQKNYLRMVPAFPDMSSFWSVSS